MNVDHRESYPAWYLNNQALSTAKVYFLRDADVYVNDLSEADVSADLLVRLAGEGHEPVPVHVIGVRRLHSVDKPEDDTLFWRPEREHLNDAALSLPTLVFVFSAEDDHAYVGVVTGDAKTGIFLTRDKNLAPSHLLRFLENDLSQVPGAKDHAGDSIPTEKSVPLSRRTLDLLKRLV